MRDKTKTRLLNMRSDETETRLDCKIISRPRLLINFQRKWDRDWTRFRISHETESNTSVSRPRQDRDSRQSVVHCKEVIKWQTTSPFWIQKTHCNNCVLCRWGSPIIWMVLTGGQWDHQCKEYTTGCILGRDKHQHWWVKNYAEGMARVCVKFGGKR